MANNPLSALDTLLGDQSATYAAGVNYDFVAAAYPAVFKQHGSALEFASSGVVKRISESFFAAILGPLGSPESPVVYISAEDRFYQYQGKGGIYHEVARQSLQAQIAEIVRKIADNAKLQERVRVAFTLRFGKTSELNGVVERAKAVLLQPNFFETNVEILAVANGIINLKTGELSKFGPQHRLRNKMTVSFDPVAKCPKFSERVLGAIMTKDDAKLLQRWSGLALGKNKSQVLLILCGPGGCGKGVITRVIENIVGHANISTLRTHLLGERFELARCIGKTLLMGSDVSSDFLSNKTASALKSLTGHDALFVEVKGGHEQPTIDGRFNVLISCNSLPRIRLDGDESAWKRRLLVIGVAKKDDLVPQHDLSTELFRDEGPGILNWMIAGFRDLADSGYIFKLTEAQNALVDQCLGNSDSARHFVDQHLHLDEKGGVTAKGLFNSYVEFCGQHRWTPIVRQDFNARVKEMIEDRFGIFLRHDVPDAAGRGNRGWATIKCTFEAAGRGGECRRESLSLQAAKSAGELSDSSDTFSSIGNLK